MELLGYYSNQTKWINSVKEASAGMRRVMEEPTRLRNIVRKLMPGEIGELVEGYNQGATVLELADRFKINRQTVSKHLHRQGVKMRRQGLEPQQVADAAGLYEQGWSLARVARHYEVNTGTVWLALRACGVQMRDTHGREGTTRFENGR